MKYKLIRRDNTENDYNILFTEDGKIYLTQDTTVDGLIEKIKSSKTQSNHVKVLDNKSTALKKLTILVTSLCNLRCKYCYEKYGILASLDKENKIMSKSKAFEVIDLIYEKYCTGIEYIQFFGGEPTIAFKLVQDIIEYIKEKNLDFGLHKTKFGLVTNGLLLDDNMLSYFENENVQVTISIDGIKEIHDAVRVKINGKGSYDEVKTISAYASKMMNKNLFYELTINRLHILGYKNRSCDQWISELKHIGFRAGIIGIVESSFDKSLNLRHEDYSTFKKLIKDLVKYFFEELKTEDPIFCIDIMRIMKNILSKDSLMYSCGAGTSKLTISTDGVIVPCAKLSNNSVAMNNQDELLNFDINEIMPSTFKKKCNSCWVEKFCLTFCYSSWLNYNSEDDDMHVKCWYMQQMTENIVINIVSAIKSNEIHLLKRGIDKFQHLTSY